MSRGRIAIAVVLGFLTALVVAWWLRRDDASAASDGAAGQSGSNRAAIVRDKLAARDRGEVDLSPASVSGRVLRDDGSALAGALVLLTPKGFGDAQGRTP